MKIQLTNLEEGVPVESGMTAEAVTSAETVVDKKAITSGETCTSARTVINVEAVPTARTVVADADAVTAGAATAASKHLYYSLELSSSSLWNQARSRRGVLDRMEE